ncbi:MAG: hypothetical protein GYA52_11445 [Chloroflexi bacterium]|nr:hypothetical protein [Chloroflexota bacterium]
MGLTDLSSALWISLIAVILVFAGILMLWAIMELLVRLTTSKSKHSKVTEDAAPRDDSDMKQKAAAAAVVTALYLQNATMHTPSTTRHKMLTPWQSMHRNFDYQPQSRRKK